MRGNLLDVVLLVAAALFAVSGYRQGLVVGVLSFGGFLGGGVAGARLAPVVARSDPFASFPEPAVGLAVVVLAALAGQLAAGVLGARLRRRLTWRPARAADAVAGAAVGAVSVLLVAWLVGTAVASSEFAPAASQVRRSAVLAAVDEAVPPQAQGFFAGFRELVDGTGFPQVFSALAPTRLAPVQPPDPALAASPVVRDVRDRTFRITGVARSCSRRIEGTGFVVAPERVLTNAHVVAGVRDPKVTVGSRSLPATVVVFDPGRDVAVLRVPGLRRRPLVLAGPAAPGSDAIVVGYPQNGPFRADAARVSSQIRARGLDIYGEQAAVRSIYALRGRVKPGNSGGPLVSSDGRVYGMVFAAAADREDVGYALTAREIARDVTLGRTATQRVSTQRCA